MTTDDQRVQSLESWDESGTTRTRRVLYLGGDYEYTIAPGTGSHDRIVRLQLTATVRAMRQRRTSDGVWEDWFYEFVHRDHLGSVDAITNSADAVQQKTSFDPFGGRRATTWNADLSATGLNALRSWQDSRCSRGFTDHEHLNRTGFIHMNGRVYDPRIGRFVSPDPIVQAPWFSQSYNHYAYVFNSPLSYRDPSGFMFEGVEEACNTTECVRVYGERWPDHVTPGDIYNQWGFGERSSGYTSPSTRHMENVAGETVKIVVTVVEHDGKKVSQTRFVFERARRHRFRHTSGWERIEGANRERYAGFDGFEFDGYTKDMVRESQQEIGERVAVMVAAGAGGAVGVRVAVWVNKAYRSLPGTQQREAKRILLDALRRPLGDIVDEPSGTGLPRIDSNRPPQPPAPYSAPRDPNY